MSEAADSVATTQCAKRERWGLWRCGLKPGRVCAETLFSTRCLEDTGVLMVFAIPPTRFSQRERRAEVEGDGGGRETQKEKTREDGAQQRSVLVCANQHTHSGCALPHTHTEGRQDKTWEW